MEDPQLNLLCLDVGSTFTKAVVVGEESGELVDAASVPTTSATDVWDGVVSVRDLLAARTPGVPDLGNRDRVWICSSAGGGLRLAVVGFEAEVSAIAGQLVALSAGASIVHVTAGALGDNDLLDLRAAAPDLILLVGGTDGGNAEVAMRNAVALARAGWAIPVVLACNVDAQEEAATALVEAGRAVERADNVLPRIGTLEPASARAAIRRAFLAHVIGGKGLSAGPEFAASVRAATPDAMLDGVQVLRQVSDHDVMVIDVGGATTDVYSAVQPQGEDATLAKDVVGTLWTARTVEGDLGMRHSAVSVLAAAEREALPGSGDLALAAWVEQVGYDPALVAHTVDERAFDRTLATIAAVVATRRHARPSHPGGSPRGLQDVGILIGSGGVLRYADPCEAADVLRSVTHDYAGGWNPPQHAALTIDVPYLLCSVGLLAHNRPSTAVALAATVLGVGQGR